MHHPQPRRAQRPLAALTLLVAAIAATACGGGDDDKKPAPLPTLDGAAPLVIGHRGLPGLHPEETLPAYQAAADAGADSLEEDLHLTKDCVLVARHNPWLSDNTNIAEVAATNATVAARKRTVPGVMVDVTYSLATYGGPAKYLSDRTDPADPKSVLKSLVVDGEDHTGDWSITDFTLAELKQWIAGTTYDARDQRPTAENGKFPVLSMQEIIDLAKAKSAEKGRTIAVYPETKNPTWHRDLGLPLEDKLIALINAAGWNSKTAPIFVQSFEPGSLKEMRAKGLNTRMVQLIDADDYDLKAGTLTYAAPYDRPYDWTRSGQTRLFSSMVTPAGLAEIKTYADGIGPWKP